jgi:hypothetical protein
MGARGPDTDLEDVEDAATHRTELDSRAILTRWIEMTPQCHAYEWTGRDKLTYFLALAPFLIGFVGALLLVATLSVYWTLTVVALFLLGAFFQAGCCVGCPYRGRYCPALFGIFPANLISARIYRDREYDEKFFKKNAALAETVVAIIAVLCCVLLFTIHWVLPLAFLALGALHVLFFFRRICPKCGYNETCPGGRAALKLGNRTTS